MIVQGFDAIEVDSAKLRDYCLSQAHPRGRHKARVFRSRLGLVADDAEVLREALIAAARNCQTEIRRTTADEYGERYVLDFDMTTATGFATIRSMWIARSGENVLRLISCYVV
jgi:hypothetical protein